MGEGAATLVVEELEHARARDARIYAEVLGYSLNNEAYHMTSPLPSGEAVIACMREALADAQLESGAIDYINCHASGTQLNDANECASIRAVFGEKCPPVSGTKAFTAHPLGATGAMETAICALALAEGFIPATLHHQTPDLPAISTWCQMPVVPTRVVT